MGNFYVNVTLKGPDQEDISRYLTENEYQAFVSPTTDGFTVVCEAECDKQNEHHIRRFTSELSEHFDCPALAILNHDDDVLCYWLYENGVFGHDYDSEPGFFDPDPDSNPFDDEDLDEEAPIPVGGDAPALCRALGSKADPSAVERVLRQTDEENEKYLFVFERHSDLAAALGLPAHSVFCGFRCLAKGEYPQGLNESDFLRT